MGDLVISGGEETTVATEGMRMHSQKLGSLAHSIGEWRQSLESPAARCLQSELSMYGASYDPLPHILTAQSALKKADELASSLHHKLIKAAEAYGAAERASRSYLDSLGAFAGWVVGASMPFWAMVGVLSIPTVVLTGVVAAIASGSPAKVVQNLMSWAQHNKGRLRDPRFVELVRQGVSAADNVMLGAAGVPFGVSTLLDDRMTGWFGLHGAATMVVLAGGSLALKETPVVVHRTAQTIGKPPTGFTDLADRIPSSKKGAPQVRVERYDTDGGRPKWVVYVGGTIDPGFIATDEPWDDTSNLQGIAKLDPGSIRAAQEALSQAGAQPGDELAAVGYSQGGIVATALAADDTYDCKDLVTFGSPTGQMHVPSDVTNVAVEHVDDLIPAMGGAALPAADGGLNRLVIRGLSSDTPPDPGSNPLEAHAMTNYANTAQEIDAEDDLAVTNVREKLKKFTAGEPATVTMWRADRVHE